MWCAGGGQLSFRGRPTVVQVANDAVLVSWSLSFPSDDLLFYKVTGVLRINTHEKVLLHVPF